MGVFFLNWFSAMEGPTKNLCFRVSLFAIYLIAGAAIFQSLESHQDVAIKMEFENVKRSIQNRYGINDTEMTKFLELVKEAIDEGYSEVDFDRWCFVGSMLFAATVLTTIGYGHIAPQTFGGRLFCIVYAFFGIPLTGLMLKSIGERLMEAVDITLTAFNKTCLRKETKSAKITTMLLLFAIMTAMILLLSSLAVIYEDWTFFEGIYFSFITLSTIGFGDFVPSQPKSTDLSTGKVLHHTHVALFIIVTFLYITVGLSVVSSVLLSVTRLFESKTEWDFMSLRNDEDDEAAYIDEARSVAKEKSFDELERIKNEY